MFQKPPNADALDKAIANVLLKMEGHSPDSDEYAKMVKQLVKLHSLKVAQTPKRISNDTWATISANLVGIVLILNYEHTDALTSTAVNFVQKLH